VDVTVAPAIEQTLAPALPYNAPGDVQRAGTRSRAILRQGPVLPRKLDPSKESPHRSALARSRTLSPQIRSRRSRRAGSAEAPMCDSRGFGGQRWTCNAMS
jgi:hypothetical protein